VTKYHISPESGDPAPCKATARPCPFGDDEDHYPSKEKAREAFERSQERITVMAASLHKDWADARNYEPRLKDDGHGGEIDIANTSFEKLPYQWQQENLAAAEAALSRVKAAKGDIDLAAAGIHEDWLSRNGEWAEPHQKLSYEELSEEEKEKDRVVARIAAQYYKG
jgi:thiamine pyrophosphate-dependent acetolactate synthase large subunit-like protein